MSSTKWWGGVKQHSEFEQALRSMLFDRNKREEFYIKILWSDWGKNCGVDTFKDYFEEYAAERKSNQQDYTPNSISYLLASLTASDAENMAKADYTAIDMTAGTGSLIIGKWWNDCQRTNPFDYRPHDYFYYCEEYADNAIPYLLHNLALRGMNAIVIHGDTLERKAKAVYFVQNAKDDMMCFSSINVLPRTKSIEQEFNIKEWIGEPINHIEDKLEDVKYNSGGKMHHQGLHSALAEPAPYVPRYQHSLKDIAVIERAKAKKQYPPGTIIIQLSATRGQVGMLTSHGEVQSHYACIQLDAKFDRRYMHLYLKHIATPRHFHRVQEGLNLTLDNIETIPIHPWVMYIHGCIDLLTNEEVESYATLI